MVNVNSSIATSGGGGYNNMRRMPTIKNSRVMPQGFGIQIVADVPNIHEEILQNLTLQNIKRGSNLLDYSRNGVDENFLH